MDHDARVLRGARVVPAVLHDLPDVVCPSRQVRELEAPGLVRRRAALHMYAIGSEAFYPDGPILQRPVVRVLDAVAVHVLVLAAEYPSELEVAEDVPVL